MCQGNSHSFTWTDASTDYKGGSVAIIASPSLRCQCGRYTWGEVHPVV